MDGHLIPRTWRFPAQSNMFRNHSILNFIPCAYRSIFLLRTMARKAMHHTERKAIKNRLSRATSARRISPPLPIKRQEPRKKRKEKPRCQPQCMRRAHAHVSTTPGTFPSRRPSTTLNASPKPSTLTDLAARRLRPTLLPSNLPPVNFQTTRSHPAEHHTQPPHSAINRRNSSRHC